MTDVAAAPWPEPAGADAVDPAPDPLGAAVALSAGAGPVLRAFNAAGVLAAADVHVACRLVRMARSADEAGAAPGDDAAGDESVALAVALAVRAPRLGHVAADLRTASVVVASDTGDEAIDALPWPDPDRWLDAVAASPLVAVGDGPSTRPVRLTGSAVGLDRYWRDEVDVAAGLVARATAPAPVVEPLALAAALDRHFGPAADPDQRRAAEVAARRMLTVVAGGPGTGKTTTVARLLAVLFDLAAASGGRPPLVALAAPTGKAAARLEQAVRAEVAGLPAGSVIADRAAELTGVTLHRLLGVRRGSERPRHHRGHRLAADVVVVDEASMVALGLMARLLDAVRPDARLVLVGDPDQLVSVEAGAVLADIVAASGAGPLEGAVAELRTNHRAEGALPRFADAVRGGRAGEALELLASGDPTLTWVVTDPSSAADPAAAAIGDEVVDWATALVDVARAGDIAAALDVLGRHRVLCAHRRGPLGAPALNVAIERAVASRRPDLRTEGPWYAGRPVLVTANDYGLRLFNGDTGVAVRAGSGSGVEVAVGSGGGGGLPRLVGPGRLARVETVFAATVHKSQGSEFAGVTVVVPEAGSRLATRELLYTAVTRARRRCTVIGTAEALAAAIARPVTRASGLTARLR